MCKQHNTNIKNELVIDNLTHEQPTLDTELDNNINKSGECYEHEIKEKGDQ